MTESAELTRQMGDILQNQKRIIEINEVVGNMILKIQRMMFALIVLVIIGLFLILCIFEKFGIKDLMCEMDSS